MFGHDHKDEDKQQDDDLQVQPMSTQPVNNGLLGIDDDDDDMPGSAAPSVSEPPTMSAPDVPAGTELATPAFGDTPDETTTDPDITRDDQPALSEPTISGDDELLDIKKQALEELSPLIDHLDQSADEKFRTTMMMIQASDNKALIPQAFSAAKDISDDKKRAQALLDIVNEINYFTHQKGE